MEASQNQALDSSYMKLPDHAKTKKMLDEVFNPYIDPQFKVHVSDITFAYDNQDLIGLLKDRG